MYGRDVVGVGVGVVVCCCSHCSISLCLMIAAARAAGVLMNWDARRRSFSCACFLTSLMTCVWV